MKWEGAKEALIKAVDRIDRDYLYEYMDPNWDEFVPVITALIKKDSYGWTSFVSRAEDKKADLIYNIMDFIPESLRRITPAEDTDKKIRNKILFILKSNFENYTSEYRRGVFLFFSQWLSDQDIKQQVVDNIINGKMPYKETVALLPGAEKANINNYIMIKIVSNKELYKTFVKKFLKEEDPGIYGEFLVKIIKGIKKRWIEEDDELCNLLVNSINRGYIDENYFSSEIAFPLK